MPGFASKGPLPRHAQELIDQCAAYCALTGIEPLCSADDSWLARATVDYHGDFVSLNDQQRRLIAGLAREAA